MKKIEQRNLISKYLNAMPGVNLEGGASRYIIDYTFHK